MKKWIKNAHGVFYAQTQIPSKKQFFGVAIYKNLYAVYVSLRRYDFVVKVIKNGHREVKNSLVWKKGCRMSRKP